LRTYEEALRATALWVPFPLMFLIMLGVRSALVLPIEPRANWVFRVTEIDDTRTEQLNAVAHAFVWLGVVWPLLALFPIEWTVLGTDAVAVLTIAALVGLVLVEVHMLGWRRLPFTCSYMPGKRFVGHTLLIGGAAFVVFTSIGSGLATLSVRGSLRWVLTAAFLAAIVIYARHRRAWVSRRMALLFEDVLPNEVEPLQLSP
jgi:hypothetical protein